LNYETIEEAGQAAAAAEADHALAHLTQEVRARPKSGFYGVTAAKKRWAAQINYGGNKHSLGSFDTKQQAALVYDREARKHGGGEKLLNYETIEQAMQAAAAAEAEHALAHPPQEVRARPPSGFYGVYAYGKRWAAYISYGGKQHRLGCFGTKQQAALVYDREARQHGGGEKPLNYESIEEAEQGAAEAKAEHALAHPPQEVRARPSSGFYGVYANGKGWQATICYGGKQHNLGCFDTKQEAALVYDREARKLGGGEKPLNYETIEEAEQAAIAAETEHALAHPPPQVRARPRSGFYGVKPNGKRWEARISYSGKQHHLGSFDTKQQAALVYDREAREHGGGEKPLNYETIEQAKQGAAAARACM
jgi:hypothetical protein